MVIPYLEKLKKEGEAGRKKITQYARYGTVVLSLIQGFGIAVGLESMSGPGGEPMVIQPGWAFRLMTMITLTSGTAFIMWLGEQITERGIGNGISLIIFAGIVARMPTALANTWQIGANREMNFIFVSVADSADGRRGRVSLFLWNGGSGGSRCNMPSGWWAERFMEGKAPICR